MSKEMKETAVGTRLPREIYAKAMDLRETELSKINPAALTPMDWIAFLLTLLLILINEFWVIPECYMHCAWFW